MQAALVTEDDVPLPVRLCRGLRPRGAPTPQCSDPRVEIVGATSDDLGLTARCDELAGEVEVVITIDHKIATFVRLGTDSGTTTREPRRRHDWRGPRNALSQMVMARKTTRPQ